MNVHNLVLVNGTDGNGNTYTNEPAIILSVMSNIYLVKFISTYSALGTTHPLHGENTAEIHGNYLKPTNIQGVSKHLNLSHDYVNQRINAIISVPPVYRGDLVLVNGQGMNGIMYTQEPGIIINDSNNRYTVKFLKNGLDVAVFIDRRCLVRRNKNRQLDEISSITKMSVDSIRNLINGIHVTLNLPLIKKGGNKKSLIKKRSYNKKYNSLKKSKQYLL